MLTTSRHNLKYNTWTQAMADTLRTGMEPLAFPQQESVDLGDLLDDTLFNFLFEDEQWVDYLLDDAFQVNVSIPFHDFGSDYAPAYCTKSIHRLAPETKREATKEKPRGSPRSKNQAYSNTH
jgi:hypothetical protein